MKRDRDDSQVQHARMSTYDFVMQAEDGIPAAIYDPEVLFGTPAEWTAFKERNREFLNRFVRVTAALNLAFARTFHTDQPIDRIVHALGRQSADDFFEILLLAGNAEGFGAHKLLRAMFERVVLLKHLQGHPTEVDDYLDYHWVSKRKAIRVIEDTLRRDAFDPEKVAEVEQQYQRVKERFRVKACDKCGTSQINFSWTPLSVVDMAKKLGLSPFLYDAYYAPLAQTHPSISGVLRRFEETDGGVAYADRLSRLLADSVLCTAHRLLIHVISVQSDHFQIDGLAGLFHIVEADYVEIWRDSGFITIKPAHEPA
jgi:hypothetical protein